MDKQKSKKLLWVLLPLIVVLCGIVLLMQMCTTYTVSFYDTDGTLLASDNYAGGENLVLPENPVKEGTVFSGWILEGEESLYDFTGEHALEVHGDMVFTASFGAGGCTVKFLDANGMDVISSHTYLYNEEIAVPNDPEKTGHSFVGWVRQGDASTYDFNADGAKNAKEDMIFVAKFEANKYKIVFKDAEGNEHKAFTLRYGDYFVVPDTVEREGYAFDGWALDGEEAVYDFTAANATQVADKDLVFVPLYTKLTTVTGKLVRLDGTAYAGKVTFCFGETEETVTTGKNGWFSVQVRPGSYSFKLKSTVYRCLPEAVTVEGDSKYMGTVTMLQALQKDFTWWNGAQKTERGTSATISTASNAHAEAATEYKLGNNIMSAKSWKITSHIEAGATGIVGFSIGRDNGNNGTVYFYVNNANGNYGFFTWDTFKYTGTPLSFNNYGTKGSGTPSDEVKAAMKSADGFDLTLTATNIDGEGTGWLTLYVNDTAVMTVYNHFVGVEAGGKGVDGQRIDLGNVHLSLAVMGKGAKAVFKNYMHQSNGTPVIQEVQVTGKLVKADKTALADKVTVQCGSATRTVNVAEDGSFTAAVPAGTNTVYVAMDGYWGVCGEIKADGTACDFGTVTLLQNLTKDYAWWSGASLTQKPGCAVLSTAAGANAESGTEYRIGNTISDAESWRVEAQIGSGDQGKVGYSIGRNDGNNGTVVFYVDREAGTYGFFTWSTHSYTGAAQMFSNIHAKGYTGHGALDKALAAEMENGYKLTLTATNIDGEGTGWLTLYVNDTAVMTLDAAEFTGVLNGGKGVNGQKMDLSNGHLSLVVIGEQAQAAFENYYYVLNTEQDLSFGTVTGTCTKVDGTAGFPETVILQSGTIYQEVSVAEDGTFSAKLPVGTYTASGSVSGYRAACNAFDVVNGQNTNVNIKLLQVLTQDVKWWGGATKTESGASAVLSTASGAHSESATEYKLGSSIEDATSWKVTSHIEAGSTGIVGFSVGRDDGNNGTVYLYVNNTNGNFGFFTWDTFTYSGTPQGINNYGTKGSGASSDAVKAAMKSAEGYDLTLTATNIDGEGTGWLTLYVNDTAVVTLYNNFVGAVAGGKGVAGQRMDLGNVHVSLAAMGEGISATFTDYYYTVNSEAARKVGTVSGKLVKLDGTALPTTALLQFGNEYRFVDVAADGSFTAQLAEGAYTVSGTADGYRAGSETFTVTDGQTTNVTVKLLQTLKEDFKWWGGSAKTESGASVTFSTASGVNNLSATEYKLGDSIVDATSWKVTSHIEAGATGIVGFSIGREGGNNGAIYLYVNKNNNGCGFYTWSTFNYSGKIPNFNVWGANGSGATSAEVQAMLNSEDGFDLTLTATNIDGEGTGWLTLYVNDTAVLTMYNNFVGVLSGGKGVNGQRIDLGNVHVSLAAMGEGISATFTDYYYTVNTETARKVGTVSGKLEKLDGTALPATALLQFGEEYRYVKIAADGTFQAQLPEGTYVLTYAPEGYRAVCDEFSVADGQNTDITVKLLQTLEKDFVWFDGTTKTENGASVTLTTTANARANSATEYKLGNSLENATSWEVSAKIEANATGLIGFSIGREDGNNGTVYLYVNKANGKCGFYTWGTFKYFGTVPGITVWTTNGSGDTSSDIAALLKSGEAFDLTLTATDINGEGTGWLTLYVNDTAVLTMRNNFVGVLTGGKGVNDQWIDLGNVHVSVAAMSTGGSISATFTDYYCKVTDEAAQTTGTVNGQLVKLDGTAYPTKAQMQFGNEYRLVKIAADGSFTTQLPAGTYTLTYTLDGYRTVCDEFSVADGATTDVTVKLLQNLTKDFTWWKESTVKENGASVTFTTGAHAQAATEYKIGNSLQDAASWKVTSHIEDGSSGIVGFSVGRDDGNNGTVYIYVNKNNNGCGFYTWGTFKYSGTVPNFNVWGANGSGATSAEVQAMLNSEDGFDLTLAATNIDGEGTGILTLYVNETAVLTMDASKFTGVLSGGKGVNDQRLDLANSHVSLVAMGNNISATFTDYCYQANN